MRGILRSTVFNSISLSILSQLLPGVKINGGIQVLLLSGLILSILFKVLKPILNIFSLPLNALTLGLFSFITNAILLYLLTIIVPNVVISGFTFNGFSFSGFIIPVLHLSTIWAYIVSAAILSLIIHFFDWLTKR